ncbi:MAG: ABC transporter ATP-binding protein [Anaerolineales bacterium]|nr:ABC transporter ATP-binding protein [Anaerolineales bacterium]
MSKPILQIENLGKRYRLGQADEQPRTLRETLSQMTLAPFAYWRKMVRPATTADTLWAVRHLSANIQAGEAVGIIGRNGSGKSTLLKMLSRITEPSEGRAIVRGRVGSLLEVGTGFHPELTGRENVYLSGTILGMSRREIERKFDEIVAFSEIERFIDTPVKRYSSGMFVRLAFSVAAHLDSELLILDEVLAVGDEAFRNKSRDKMSEVARDGRAILLVSHNMGAILTLCPRTIWLDCGSVAADDESETVVAQYLGRFKDSAHVQSVVRSWGGALDITRVSLRNLAGEEQEQFRSGEPLTVEIHYQAHEPVREPYFWVGVAGHTGHLFTAQMAMDGYHPAHLTGTGQLRVTFHSLPLMPRQQYFVLLGAVASDGHSILVPKTEVARFMLTQAAADIGLTAAYAEIKIRQSASVLVPYTWELPDGRSATVNYTHLPTAPARET